MSHNTFEYAGCMLQCRVEAGKERAVLSMVTSQAASHSRHVMHAAQRSAERAVMCS